MKIAILGSTGFVGGVLLAKALEAGHKVRTLVRDPGKLGEARARVDFVQGDYFDPAALRSVLKGSEAVLSTVGPPQGNPGSPLSYGKAMGELIGAMEELGVRRLIHIGGAAHGGGEGEEWSMGRLALKALLSLLAKPILEAKHLEWEALKVSSLDWTLVRPPRIVAATPRGYCDASDRSLPKATVPVEDLAAFMLDQLVSREWVRRAPLVC